MQKEKVVGSQGRSRLVVEGGKGRHRSLGPQRGLRLTSLGKQIGAEAMPSVLTRGRGNMAGRTEPTL